MATFLAGAQGAGEIVQGLEGLFGSSGSTSGSQSGSQTVRGTTAIEGDQTTTQTGGQVTTGTTTQEQDLLSLLASVLTGQSAQQTQQQQSGEASTLSAANLRNVEQLLATTTQRLGENLDLDEIQANAINQVLEQGIGKVIESGQNQGAFDSTAQATAAERLGSRATVEGTQARTQAALTEQGQLLDAVNNLNEVLKGAQTTSETQSTGAEQATQTQRQTQQQQQQQSGTSTTEEEQVLDQTTTQVTDQTQTVDQTTDSSSKSKQDQEKDGLFGKIF